MLIRCLYGYDVITFRLSLRYDRIALGSKARVQARGEPAAVAPARLSRAPLRILRDRENPSKLRSIPRKLASYCYRAHEDLPPD